MILGFMKRFPDKTETKFKEKILRGIYEYQMEKCIFDPMYSGGITNIQSDNNEIPKLHTIRNDQHKRWKEGMEIHFCTGVRTKQMDNFAMGACKSVQEIEIWYLSGNGAYPKDIIIDGRRLEYKEINEVVLNDGFKNGGNFLKYFRSSAEYEDSPKGDYPVYRGRLIHWTDLRY
jgi:hypothetical protein